MVHTLHCWGIAIGFVLCWSSGFVGGELAQQTNISALWLFAWRFLIAGGLAACLGLLFSPWPSTKILAQEALTGSLTVGGYLLGIMLALHYGVSVAITALITSLQPMLVTLITNRRQHKRQGKAHQFGMLIATAGVALCLLADFEHISRQTPLWAYLLPFGALTSITLGSLIGSQHQHAPAMLPTLSAQFLAAAVLFAIAALGMTPPDSSPAWPDLTNNTSSQLWAALTWLVLLSSFGGYGFYVACLRQLGVIRTTQLIYLSPGVTLIWSALMFEHPLTLLGVSGMVIALAGVLWSQRQERHSKPLQPTHIQSKSSHYA